MSARGLAYAALVIAALMIPVAGAIWDLSLAATMAITAPWLVVTLVLFRLSTAVAESERARRDAVGLARFLTIAETEIPASRACDHALLNATEEDDHAAAEAGDPAFEGDGVELVADGRLRRVGVASGTGMPAPSGGAGRPRRAEPPPEGMPTLAELREGVVDRRPWEPKKPPPTIQETVFAAPWQMELLRDQTLINLGHYGTLDLITEVPRDFEPSLERESMLDAYLSPWLDAQTLSFEDAEANVQAWKQGESGGLFWTGEGGYVLRAWLWAIVTTHSFAHLVDDVTGASRYDADEYRAMAEDGKVPLRFIVGLGEAGYLEHAADGRILSHDSNTNALAWTYFGQIRIRANTRIHPLLADYYLWWAWRLYAWAREGDGGYLDEFMGLCCARAGMAEIVQMATLIVHEVGHLKGSSYHCHSGVGFFDCSQYLMEWTFLHRTMAALGLPAPHHPNFAGANGPVGGTDWRFSEVTVAGDVREESILHSGVGQFSGFGEIQEFRESEPDCRDATGRGTHEWVLTAGRPVRFTYHVPWHCSKVPQDQDGTIVYT